ncbi:hypothetical protein A4D02_09580 [Niastella koreensis]|uniref:PKD domain containing protein n=2 Tax=Niastella koreensis TaxID=354356 RepID=G8TN85_NIAKG|nr:PKD domain-containing protein [Niastella koreensis]AEV98787.1 PKD domain containing protein [Niastella koreensis GR20-10]OQP43723.1 hypothetical protein A4D02_09580 [Niastella koreensis]
MKKITVFVSMVFIIAACKKKEVINLYEPRACFWLQNSQSFLATQYQDSGSATYIDSNFYFTACYDSTGAYVYDWNFGDGTTSAERNPVHKYSKRGKYQVTLTVANDSKVSHTAQKNVWVALGEKYITFNNTIDVYPLAVEETVNNEFVLLGASGNNASFYLMRFDSLLNQQSMKTFPAGYRFRSMQAVTDGNYIVTGTTQGAGKTNELIKIKADGTVLWNKNLSSDVDYTNAAQTPDGGYVVVGSKTINVPNVYGLTTNVTVVDKTDNNGNQQWEKIFDGELMIKTSDAAIEQDGIVMAGVVKRYNYSLCSTCDSLRLTKLDYSGNTVWKNTILWALNTYDFAGTHTTKLTNGNYAVYNDTTQAVYYFTADGQFVDRIFAENRIINLVNSADGKLFTLLDPGNYLGVSKLGIDGKEQWLNSITGGKPLNGNLQSVFSKPVTIRRLRNGSLLVVGKWNVYNTSGFGTHAEILLLQLNENGKPI